MNVRLAQFGDCHCVMSSMTTFVALPMVRGTGLAKDRVDAPAVAESFAVAVSIVGEASTEA